VKIEPTLTNIQYKSNIIKLMNFIEYHQTIINTLSGLELSSEYIQGNQDFSYQVSNLDSLRRSINNIEDIPFIENEINILKTSWLFQSVGDSMKITSSQKLQAETELTNLKLKLVTFRQIAEASKIFKGEDILLIRIPEVNSFDNLQKYASDFKKAIEIPVLDKGDGNVTIVSADEGSVILYVSLGAVTALKLVAGICWAAAVIRKKRAEASIFEQHAKTLKLKNEALTSIIEAQQEQLKNILHSEAEAIANKEYNLNDHETIERLKLSISTVSELIDRGVKILPISSDNELRKSFPDYKKLDLIESTIKQIAHAN
jgi:hypothetical protein